MYLFIQRYSVGTLLILVRCTKHSAVYKLENGRCDRLIFILILYSGTGKLNIANAGLV